MRRLACGGWLDTGDSMLLGLPVTVQMAAELHRAGRFFHVRYCRGAVAAADIVLYPRECARIAGGTDPYDILLARLPLLITPKEQ